MSDLRKDREQEREREKDREEQSEKERGQLENLKAGTAIFYNLILVVMYCRFYYMLLVIQTIPGTVWEGPTKGIVWRFPGIMLEAAYPTSSQGRYAWETSQELVKCADLLAKIPMWTTFWEALTVYRGFNVVACVVSKGQLIVWCKRTFTLVCE